MSKPNARVLAVHRLLRIETDGAYVARLTESDVPADVSRQAVSLVAGVTRHRRWLDFLLNGLVRGRLTDLDPELHQVLRIGAYDLVVRDKASHAAVNEAVIATKILLHKGAGGFANGVLRSLDRLKGKGLPEPATGDVATDLATRHSHPTWMVRRWLETWGADETRQLLASNNAPARFTLRAAALEVDALLERLQELHVEASPSEWSPDFVEVERLQPVLRSGLLEDGSCAVQDVAAGLVVDVLDPQPGDRVLDAAAAPGGKALYAAKKMRGEGTVVALDVTEAKTALIRRAARAQGVDLEVVTGDLTTWRDDTGFDRVLLDAPCSGTGVLSKRADLRWRRTPSDLEDLVALQDTLLDAAAVHVRPGGLLVYSTCSIEAEENEGRVSAFLERTPDFALEPVGDAVPSDLEDDGFYRALPHRHHTDGAFAARLGRSS
ncbi:16S rRNA (cytosine(967)-C(5))-methyltransferase RsmB [Rubrivirga sp.]|uniref:16S rRNA (cytosine(967)-C(5))-methyltransferase RsmB n=1 Tax=Rubrivirga sp. TaxID=1885344 RepID=UPI003C77E3F4